MYNVLIWDFLKYRKDKTIWVLYLVIVLISVMYASILMRIMANSPELMTGFEYLLSLLTDNFTIFLAAIASVVFLGRDFKNRSYQDAVCLGYNRYHLMISKAIIVAVLYISFAIVGIVSGTIVVTLQNGFHATFTVSVVNQTILLFFVNYFIGLSLVLLFCILRLFIQSNGLLIGIGFFFMFTILPVINGMSVQSHIANVILSWTPLGQFNIISLLTIQDKIPLQSFAVGIGYTVLFVWLLGFIFNKKDLS